MDKEYEISFITEDEATWIGLNGKKMYMDYEENVIESENFVGFASQLMAMWMGLTDGVIGEEE